MAKGAYIGVQRELPPGYTQLSHISSTGTQFINTHFKPTSATRIICNVTLQTGSTAVWLFGARLDNQTDSYGFLVYQNGYRSDYKGSVGATTISNSYGPTFKLDKNREKTYMNDKLVDTMPEATFSCDYDLVIFANNTAGTISGQSTATIEDFIIYDDGILQRDYIPCQNPSGEIGMYDTVNGEFYGNDGTDDFIGGSPVYSVARKISKGYFGVGNLARKIKKAYIGIGGKARPCWSGGEFVAYGSITPLSNSVSSNGAASNGNYALFAGGTSSGVSSAKDSVDAYDTSLVLNSGATLSSKRQRIAGTSLQQRAFLYGGLDNSSNISNACDTYDVNLTRMTSTEGNRTYYVAGANLAGYALFAGGTVATSGTSFANYVRAFDASLTMIVLTSLEAKKTHVGAASTPLYAIFAGGEDRDGGYSSAVAYNTSLTQSILQDMSQDREYCIGAAAGDNAIFIGYPGDSDSAAVYNENLTCTTVSRPNIRANDSVSGAFENLAVFTGLGESTSGALQDQTIIFDESLTCQQAESLPFSARNGAATTIGNYFIVAGGYPSTSDAYAYTIA